MPSIPGESSTRYNHRSHLLQEAEKIITKDRNKSYGDPDEDFQRIAAIASAMGFRKYASDVADADGLRNPAFRDLSGHDVALFMIALKLSRLAWMPTHRDSWIDIAGYAGCGFETAALEEIRRQHIEPFDAGVPHHDYDGCPICERILGAGEDFE